MATTGFGVNDSQTVKLWRRKLFRESLKSTVLYKFMGSDTGAMIQILDEPSKGPGDAVTVTLRTQLAGLGIQGDGTLEGNEEALGTYTDQMVINQQRHAVRSRGRMSEQRIAFSHRDEARAGLQDWWAARIDTCGFNQLAGITVDPNGTLLTGNNSATAIDSNHQIVVGSTSADNLSATSTCRFSLTAIDQAVEKAEVASGTGQVPIRPLMIGGDEYYVCFLHPYQVTDLRTSTSTGQWLDIQKTAMQGGEVTSNPIFSGALGVYNKTILHRAFRVTSVQNSAGTGYVASTKRALFCGAQAACMAFGRDNGPDTMTWVEEAFDYGNQLGVAAGMIFGLKRTIFNSNSFGAMVIDTYAAAAA